jgi:hypothetical protein
MILAGPLALAFAISLGFIIPALAQTTAAQQQLPLADVPNLRSTPHGKRSPRNQPRRKPSNSKASRPIRFLGSTPMKTVFSLSFRRTVKSWCRLISGRRKTTEKSCASDGRTRSQSKLDIDPGGRKNNTYFPLLAQLVSPENGAIVASLIETSKLIGLEPHNYLVEVITRIVDRHAQRHLDELPPLAYRAAPAPKA